MQEGSCSLDYFLRCYSHWPALGSETLKIISRLSIKLIKSHHITTIIQTDLKCTSFFYCTWKGDWEVKLKKLVTLEATGLVDDADMGLVLYTPFDIPPPPPPFPVPPEFKEEEEFDE